MHLSELFEDPLVQEAVSAKKIENYPLFPLLLKMYSAAYPKAKFQIRDKDRLESLDHQLTILMYPMIEKPYVGFLMHDVATGKYKGVLQAAMKRGLKDLLKLAPGYKPAIWVEDDESAGAWEHIAKNLKIKLIVPDQDENYDWDPNDVPDLSESKIFGLIDAGKRPAEIVNILSISRDTVRKASLCRSEISTLLNQL